MRMGRKKGTNKRGGGYVYVEGGGRHWRSGAIYVTCAVGNSDCRCWQLENQAKARHRTDSSTDTAIGDQPSLPSPSALLGWTRRVLAAAAARRLAAPESSTLAQSAT
jgi:hypothetical protein